MYFNVVSKPHCFIIWLNNWVGVFAKRNKKKLTPEISPGTLCSFTGMTACVTSDFIIIAMFQFVQVILEFRLHWYQIMIELVETHYPTYWALNFWGSWRKSEGYSILCFFLTARNWRIWCAERVFFPSLHYIIYFFLHRLQYP